MAPPPIHTGDTRQDIVTKIGLTAGRHARRCEMLKIVALGAAFALASPLAWAQPAQVPPTSPSAAISDGTISKAGAALRDVAQVQQKYQPMIEAAPPAQKQTLSSQANADAARAIQSHGLSVQEYTNVVRTAQNDPSVKQRLLSAAGVGGNGQGQ